VIVCVCVCVCMQYLWCYSSHHKVWAKRKRQLPKELHSRDSLLLRLVRRHLNHALCNTSPSTSSVSNSTGSRFRGRHLNHALCNTSPSTSSVSNSTGSRLRVWVSNPASLGSAVYGFVSHPADPDVPCRHACNLKSQQWKQSPSLDMKS
jgi:hypothetical protein